MVRQVTVTSTAVVFPEDPPEKDPVPEVDCVRCLEKAQGPVRAEAQDLWSWNQWLRHSSNSTAAPEGFSPPISLGLVRRLVLSQNSQLGWVWLKTMNIFLPFKLCHYLQEHRVGWALSDIPSLSGSEN